MYYSAIGLLAVLVLLIENYDVLENRRGDFEKPAWMVYRRFLFAVLAYYITDILWGFLESRKLSRLLFFDTTVYFIAMAMGVLFWAQYTVVYLDEKTEFGQYLLYAGRAVGVFISFLAVVNVFIPVIFTVDTDCIYRALPVRYVILSIQILMFFLISAYSYTYFRLHQRKAERYRILAVFGLIMGLFLFAQLWFPYLPLYSIAYMLGTCLLHTFVINDEKEEYRRGMNEAAEIADLKQTMTSLLDNMPAMTFSKDAETGVYLTCNKSFAEYADKSSPDEVLGLTDAEIFDAKTAAKFKENDRIAVSMDQPFIFYEDVRDAVGNQRQFQNTRLKYTDTAGRVCILGIYQDVTDLVRIQHENATTKEAYEKALASGIIYTHIAQALARGYSALFYVNLDTEGFIEYRPDEDSGSLMEVRRGWHFFELCMTEAKESVYPDDLNDFMKALDRKTLVATLDRDGAFVITYRLMLDNEPRYVSLRVSRMEDDDRYVILGITDFDEQMKQRRLAERMMEEQIAYARLSALTGDYLCIYVVVPETGRYREFSAARNYETFAQAKEGPDFFKTVREAAGEFAHPDDLSRFLSVFTRENVMAEIESCGIFTISYRLVQEGRPFYVQLKAAMVEEKEGPRLIVGINDIDNQVRQEEEYVKHLAQAKIEANIDALTGVKNRHAYLLAEERLDAQISDNTAPEFAIAILDVNDLKKVNDTVGHKAGDQYLREACKIVCTIFAHSPVFRVGGDEFAVIAQGHDYHCIEDLTRQVDDHNTRAIDTGGIVIACGMAKCEGDASVALVFERADQDMYINKSNLKERKNADERRTGYS